MKKILLIVFMVLICAGCEANYTIKFDGDLNVEERLRALEDAEFFKQYENSSAGRVVGFILEPYLDELNNKGYTTETHITNQDSGVFINKKYKSLEEYIKSTILANEFTDKINYEVDGDKVTLSAVGKFSTGGQDQTHFSVDEGSITINIPFKVIEHNADEVDGDDYTWNIDGKKGEQRELKLVFDKSSFKNGTSDKFSPIIFLVIAGVLLIGGFMLYNKIKGKRENVNQI